MALRLMEVEPQQLYDFICTPTGNEPPEFDEHLLRLESFIHTKIERLGPFPFQDAIFHQDIEDRADNCVAERTRPLRPLRWPAN